MSKIDSQSFERSLSDAAGKQNSTTTTETIRLIVDGATGGSRAEGMAARRHAPTRNGLRENIFSYFPPEQNLLPERQERPNLRTDGHGRCARDRIIAWSQ